MLPCKRFNLFHAHAPTFTVTEKKTFWVIWTDIVIPRQAGSRMFPQSYNYFVDYFVDRMGETSGLYSSLHHPLVRDWNQLPPIDPKKLIYPVFVLEEEGHVRPIAALPGQSQWSVDRLPELLDDLVNTHGLTAVLFFGVVTAARKASFSSHSDMVEWAAQEGPVPRALRFARARYANLLCMADVCLCPYTKNGQCYCEGEDKSIEYNDEDWDIRPLPNHSPIICHPETCGLLQQLAVGFACAGAHVIAPSDMMDGRVRFIRDALRTTGYSFVSIMAYSAKFASCLYGPFRQATNQGVNDACTATASSTLSKLDRSNHQLPIGSRGLAMRALKRDVEEGADMIMVKPAMWYLDVIRDARNEFKDEFPIAAYQVSGEYAMMYLGAQHGLFPSLSQVVNESMVALVRSGANLVISYFAPNILSDTWPAFSPPPSTCATIE